MTAATPGPGGIITAIAEFGTALTQVIGYGNRARRDRLPDWQTPADFRDQNNTVSLMIAGAVVVLIVVLILIAKKR